jgi:hypothetical protein
MARRPAQHHPFLAAGHQEQIVLRPASQLLDRGDGPGSRKIVGLDPALQVRPVQQAGEIVEVGGHAGFLLRRTRPKGEGTPI